MPAKHGKQQRQPRGLRPQRLSAKDIRAILNFIGAPKSTVRQQAFLAGAINKLLFIGVVSQWRRENRLSQVVARYQKLDAAISKTVLLLSNGYVREGLGYQEGRHTGLRSLTFQEVSAILPGLDDSELSRITGLGPVKSEIGEQNLSALIALLKWCQVRVREAMDDARAPGSPVGISSQSSEELRLEFVKGLAGIYTVVFNQEPKATRDGPWCLFLAAVLSKTQHQQVSADRAHEIWLKVRKRISKQQSE